MTQGIPQPDLTSRPHDAHAERWTPLSSARLYRAWTREWDLWFARPGKVVMDPQPGQPWFFEVDFEGKRHPHYGRFLHLEPNRRIEITWVTGKGGTKGAETLLTVEFLPENNGARVKLAHRGFYTADAAAQHEKAWPLVLAQQEEKLK